MKLTDIFHHSVKRLVSGVVVVILAAVAAFPARSSVSPAAMADTLYAQGEYAKAAEAYSAIAKVDGVSPGLLFNLANSYAQTGDLGHAILYYSRASRLDPTDRDIRNNLDYFVSKVEDSNRAELRGKRISVSPDHPAFFQAAARFICTGFPRDMWAYVGVGAFLLLLAQVALYLFCSDVRLRKFGFFGGICSFFISLICVVFAFMSASYYDSQEKAVLMAYKTELRVEPSSDAEPASNLLCQGTCLDIVAEETDVEGRPTWYKVRLNSDIEGWLRASDVEII